MKMLSEHWEKLLIAVILVIGILVVLVVMSGEVELLEFNKSKNADVIAGDTTINYSEVVQRAKTKAEAPTSRDVYTHKWLQYCTNCKKLHKKFSEKCPECGATVNYKQDSDGDGIDNVWEQKYKLDWTNPADGTIDSDKDGITNLEEFKRKSNPLDPSDPNVVLDEYTLIEVYRPKRPIEFVSAAGATMNFRFKGMSKFKKEGEKISHAGKDLYKVGALISKTTNYFDKSINANKTKNISEVSLTDLQSGELFKIVIGQPGYENHVEAKIVKISDNNEGIYKKNDKLPLDKIDTIAEIVELNDKNKECVFAVGNIKYITKPGK